MKRYAHFMQVFVGILLLLVGGSIYLLFRDTSLLMFRWCDYFHLSDVVANIRFYMSNILVNDFVRYNLPDGLWVLAYMLIIDVLKNNEQRFMKLWWVLYLPTIALISEIMQLTSLIEGTFDYLDLLCYLIPIILYLIYSHYGNLFKM